MILGISFSHNSSIAFINDSGRTVYAASLEKTGMEKYGHIKNAKGFPISTIREGMEKCNIPSEDIKVLMWSTYERPNLYNFLYSIIPSEYLEVLKQNESFKEAIVSFESIEKKEDVKTFIDKFHHNQQEQIENMVCYLLHHIFQIKIEYIERVEHHLAHAYAAFATANLEKIDYVVTLDGFGDGISGRVYEVQGKQLKVIDRNTVYMNGSPCLMYQYTTGSIRLQNGGTLRMLEDEYKLLGMEVHSTQENIEFFNNVIFNEKNENINTIRFKYDFENGETEQEYLDRLYGIFKENISSLQ